MKLVLLAVQLMILASAVSAVGQAQTVRFAVAPCLFTGDAGPVEWLGAGVAFDIEKRLERWSGMQPVDRLKVRAALANTTCSDEQAVAKTLFDQVKPDAMITFTGACSDRKLDLAARLWTGSSTPAQAIRLQGSLSDLFSLHDKLVDQLVSALQGGFPRLQAPEKPGRLHIAPARSVVAYELLVRGVIALHDGSASSARPSLQKAVELEPDMWWANYFLGAVEFHEGNFRNAIERCRAAIALDPDLYAGVYANLAYCYQGTGDREHFGWAKGEFERRTGKTLPQRTLPAAGFIQPPVERPAGGEKS